MIPQQLRRRPDLEPPVWIVPVCLVAFVLLVLLFAGCAADIAQIADIDGDAGSDADTGSDAALELEARPEDGGSDTALEIDTRPEDGGSDMALEIDTRPAEDTHDAGSDACAVPGGVPLGYFCSRNADCCSGICGGPDKRCVATP